MPIYLHIVDRTRKFCNVSKRRRTGALAGVQYTYTHTHRLVGKWEPKKQKAT